MVTDADCLFESRAFLHLLAPIVNGEEQVTTGVSVPFVHQRDSIFVQLQWARRAYGFSATRPYTERLARQVLRPNQVDAGGDGWRSC